MAASTAIEWCDHTWSPWLGCTAVSPGCDHCYAEGWARRTGAPDLWAGERRRTSAAYWQQPLKWERQAVEAGRRKRVFPSLCDPFDNQVPGRWRADFWHRIEQTPHLDWCLLTKRPQNIARMLPDVRTGTKPWGDGWPNVWLGVSAENQEEADRRIPHLLATPAAVRWLSIEPMLENIDLSAIPTRGPEFAPLYAPLTGKWWGEPPPFSTVIDWCVVGGESGPGARPFDLEWARSIIRQCKAAGVPCFVKQIGACPTGDWSADERQPISDSKYYLADRKGGAPGEWPEDLRIREYPC